MGEDVSTMSRVKRLTDIEIDEVSVVDRPANQHGLIAFSKSTGIGDGPNYEEDSMPDQDNAIYDSDGDEVDVDLLDHGDVVYDGEGNEYVYVEEAAEESVGKGLVDDVKGGAKLFRGGFRNPKMNVDTDSGLFRAGQHVGRHKGKYVAGGAGGAALIGGGAYAVKKSAGDEVLEALSKAVTDEDRDGIIAKALNEVEIYKAQAQEVAEKLEYEQDLRITSEYISKAAEYNLPVSPEILGPILKSVAAVLTDEQLDILDALFEAVGDALYEEVGYVGDTDNQSVLNMVDGMADEMVGKADVSKAEAMVAMFEANPTAYEAYLAENGR
jgi:hypothetical protein